MRRIVVVLAGVALSVAPSSGQSDGEAAPIYGVRISAGYRDWKMIAVTQLLVGKVD
ncbi:MAG: hypothetical protein ACRETL_11925 [Gammaproteobacteria bacterium]